MFESDDDQPAVMSADLPAGIYLLDVREDDEWAAGHAPDAIHVRLSELSVRTEEIPRDVRDLPFRGALGLRGAGAGRRRVADGQRVRRHDRLGRRRPPDDQRDRRGTLRGVTPPRRYPWPLGHYTELGEKRDGPEGGGARADPSRHGRDPCR